MYNEYTQPHDRILWLVRHLYSRFDNEEKVILPTVKNAFRVCHAWRLAGRPYGPMSLQQKQDEVRVYFVRDDDLFVRSRL